MPAGLKTLGNYCVASLVLKPARLIHRSRGRQDLRAGFSNARKKIFVRKAEMEADNLGMKLCNEVAHLVVERSPGGGLSRRILINVQLNVVEIQAFSPVHCPSPV